jgi:hypothetical protein
MFKNYGDYKQNMKKMDFKYIPYNYKDNNNKNKITIAIIIPHRNRIKHLKDFYKHINKLKKSTNHYFDIYVIDQYNTYKFNKDILLNSGYNIAKQNYNYDRYIFHDVDSYPTQELFDIYFKYIDKNIHFASPFLDYKYTFNNFFGGVVSFKQSDFEKINGYPNNFYGWGGEDDALLNRCILNDIEIYRISHEKEKLPEIKFSGKSILSYILPEHDKPTVEEYNYDKQNNILDDLINWKSNGLNQINNYNIKYNKYNYNNFINTYDNFNDDYQNKLQHSKLLSDYNEKKEDLNIYKITFNIQTNAIFMLIFGKTHYIVGAIVAASVHRKFMKKNNIYIDIVCMVDNIIYEYKDELLKYFDKVILIDLIEIKLHDKSKIIDKYSDWMKYSINKWQALRFDSYEKILFCDIDLLPIDYKFYNIFNIDTFGLYVNSKCNNFNNIINSKDFLNNVTIKNEEYNEIALKLKQNINATLVLLKPNKELYNEYLKFIKICEYNNGFKSILQFSGSDETTLLLFLLFYKNIRCKYISCDYAVIPWDFKDINKYKFKSINYASMIKPWLKIPMICWADEIIWHKLILKIIDKKSKIYDIYLSNIISNLYIFIQKYKDNINNKKSPYNMEILKNKYIYNDAMQIIKYLEKNSNISKRDFLKKIVIKANKIHKKMDKKLLLDNNILLKLFD